MKFSNLLKLYSTREAKCKPFSERYFFSIPVYVGIEKKVKFRKNWKKDENDSSLHRIPNLIVSIFVLHDPGGSHATIAKILRRKGIVSQKQVTRP